MKKNVFIIGKDPDPTFTKNNERVYTIAETADTEYVSRTHCKLTVDDGKMKIEDLNSLNGTFVDNRRIAEPTPITLRSSVTLGRSYTLNLDNFKQYMIEEPVASPLPRFQYADWWSRVGGYVLDSIFVSLLSAPLVLMFYLIIFTSAGISIYDDVHIINLLAWIFLIIGSIIITHFYYVVPISNRGYTYGRRIANIMYLDATTRIFPTKLQVWLRLICYNFSSLIFMIGFFMPLWTEKKQALHDLIVNTIVVKRQ
jgi:uncharacterized RDD family membrane protein YckC